jgi:hypothetical protein
VVNDDEFNRVAGGQLKLTLHAGETFVGEIHMRPHVGCVWGLHVVAPFRLECGLEEYLLVRAMQEIKQHNGVSYIWEDCVTERTDSRPGYPPYGTLFERAFEYRERAIHWTLPNANGYIMQIPPNPDDLLA